MRSDAGRAQRAERARARATWRVRRATLDDEGRDALCAATTPEERVAMMAALALEAWRLAGAEWPDHDRASAPIRRATLADS